MAAGPTTRRRQLGAELRRLRRRKKMSLEEAGEAVGVSRATIHRYEGNQGPVRWVIVEALCRVYDAAEAESAAVIALAKTVRVQGWWKAYADAIPDWITPLITLEDEAAEEWHWANTYVPGILQTRAYASAVIQASEMRAGDDDIARMVDVRMARQDILKRDHPPHLWAIVDEGALMRRVGGYAVMAEQMEHLVISTQSPHVTLQVLPYSAGAHPADSTGFVVIKNLDPTLDVVHLSNRSGALYLEKPVELETHRLVFEYLRSQALSATQSSEMIAGLGEKFATEAREERS
ncbi:helix-turn-helix transcriptional regulator [Streptomyces sp. H10-C2]|uniref:helix-turn-helix domain-containing protein n=1 Tax=unclassified Streptomyces TaxID=2593676 RepID=UPI0024BB0AD2|nr:MULTISPECIES: helix-turn-helix transcriptional regulator [unclassified Streptomyces]MDJ0347358.1 helix-turn-helix transcriptional regulator [Streptomyces sp. PH10-H1]MDJ0375568.1 helix-turn-helix transcriptional regulator [Streptomyces sp. H10-C2]